MTRQGHPERLVLPSALRYSTLRSSTPRLRLEELRLEESAVEGSEGAIIYKKRFLVAIALLPEEDPFPHSEPKLDLFFLQFQVIV